jgi:hypothetical protein
VGLKVKKIALPSRDMSRSDRIVCAGGKMLGTVTDVTRFLAAEILL